MPDDTTTDDAPATGAEPEPPAEDGQLGEAGKKAIETERKARQKAERDLKAMQKQLDDLQAASLSEQERAVKEAEDRGRTEALGSANARILRAEVKALAGGKLADPEDAVRLLDLTEFDVSDDGTVDTKAISSAIDELVKQKPYLSPNGQRPAPLPGGGARPSEGFDVDAWIRDQASSKPR